MKLYQKVTLLGSASALLALGQSAYAACTADAYSNNFQYKGNELVTYEGAHFKAKWWIKGQAPDKTQKWGPWQFIEDCGTSQPTYNNAVSPTSHSYTKNSGAEVAFTLQPDNGVSLVGVNGASAGDWVVSNNNLRFANTFLNSLSTGTHTYTVDFNLGNDVVVSVNIGEPAIAQPTISPASRSFNKALPADANFTLNTDGDVLSAIVASNGSALTQGSDYTFTNFELTISSNYLQTLAVGSEVLELQFEQASSLLIDIAVTDTPVGDVQVLTPQQALLDGAVLTNGQVDLMHGNARWTFNVPQTGEYHIEFDYESPYGEKTNTFFVGTKTQAIATPTTNGVATFSMDANLTAGTQELGVLGSGGNWGYIFIDSIRVSAKEIPPALPTLAPTSKTLQAGNIGHESFQLSEGDYAFSSLTLNGSELTQGVDYNVTSSALTLTADFIASLALSQNHVFSAQFYSANLGATSLEFSVRVNPEAVYEPSLSPASQTVSVGSNTPITYNVEQGSFTFVQLTANGSVLTQGVDYNVTATSLELTADYVSALPEGASIELIASFNHASSGSRNLSANLSVVQALEGNCFSHESAMVGGDAQVLADRIKVTGKNDSAAYWSINIAKAGLYKLTLTYSTEGGDKIVSYMLDDGGLPNLSWPDAPVAAPLDRDFVHQLSAGVHQVGLINRDGDWGWVSVHNLCLEFQGSLDIVSPAPFSHLPSGSDISLNFVKDSPYDVTYSVNGGSVNTYAGESPLVIPTSGDGIYDIQLGINNTTIKKAMRLQVGSVTEPQYVDTLGTQFVLGNAPFYFNGSNQYDLMYKPEAMAEDFFKRAAYLNMNVVRTWLFCNDTKTHDGVCINMKSGDDFILTKTNRTAAEQAIVDRSYELFDNYIALAHEYDQKLVLSLADHWNYFGNLDSYGSPHYGNAASIAKFKAFITEILQHRNPLTGYTYAEDPAIMMWELANEPRCSNGCNEAIFKAWAKEVSEHIRALAPNHLISIGAESSFDNNGTGDDFAFIKAVNDLETIDAVSAHLYPTWWNMTDAETLGNFDQLAEVGRALNKPTYIGEFSWPIASAASVATDLAKRTSIFADWYEKAEEHKDVIGGMLSWQLSGLEWGNGNTPLGGCQWCSGPYGEPTHAWTANNDGFQTYCAITPQEETLTATGAPGSNMEGNKIHIELHKPVCDLLLERSNFYKGLNN